MRRGDYRGAWAVNDAVLAAGRGTPDDPCRPYHLRWVWDGCAPDGRNVLVRCYHGLGDTLQFARYLPALSARASSVIVEVQPELLPLLAGMSGVDRFITFDQGHPVPPRECTIEIMELAHVLRLPPEAVPPLPLTCRPEAACAGALGLCAQAGGWDSDRSVPLRNLLTAIGDQPALRLQPDPGGYDGWLNRHDPLASVAHTARLIGSTGLVITVDTMIAHLAGSLGHPTWLLLKAEADWRWMEERRDSPWYPSLKLYRQARPGDWSPVLAEIARDLGSIRPVPSLPASAHAG